MTNSVQGGTTGVAPVGMNVATNNIRYIQADIVADIGSSGTRVSLNTNTHRFYFELQNRFAKVADVNAVNPKYLDNRSTFIQTEQGVYANGYIVDMEYQSDLERPVTHRRKVDQLVTFLTLQTVLARCTKILSEQYAIPVNELNVSFNLSVLLPPLHVAQGKEELVAKADVLNNISMIAPLQFSKQVKVAVSVLSEGVAGFFATFFKEQGLVPHAENHLVDFALGQYEIYEHEKATLAIVEENVEFHSGDLLGIDVGASTSDVFVIRNMELIESSRDTFARGGNAVEASIKNEIKQRLYFTPPSSDMKNIVTTGFVTEGSIQHDVADIVQNARDSFSKAFKGDLEEYFEANGLDPRIFKGLLVFGGGALKTEVEGNVRATSMVDYIMTYLRDIAPNMKAVYTSGNVRRLNVDGGTLQVKYKK